MITTDERNEAKKGPPSPSPGLGGSNEATSSYSYSHNTTLSAKSQSPVFHLARYLGAADADLEAIRAAWPDALVDQGRVAVQRWLEMRPDLAREVLAFLCIAIGAMEVQ